MAKHKGFSTSACRRDWRDVNRLHLYVWCTTRHEICHRHHWRGRYRCQQHRARLASLPRNVYFFIQPSVRRCRALYRFRPESLRHIALPDSICIGHSLPDNAGRFVSLYPWTKHGICLRRNHPKSAGPCIHPHRTSAESLS